MDGPVVTFKKRSAKANARKTAPPPPDSSSSGSDSEREGGRSVKRRKTGAVLNASTADQKQKSSYEGGTTKYGADTSATISANDDATRQSNWYDENAEDALSAQNLLGKSRNKAMNTENANDGTYTGAKNYGNFIQKNADAPNRQVGPVKAPTNIRTITVTDYAPDVCKDYKQTGFCGFGDNCKFLHAREDYAQGWQLDKEWEISTKGKKLSGTTVASANRTAKPGDEDEAEDKLLENIPFACIICKKPYENPIVTKCGHYFCEKCALQRYRKNPSCAACGAGTNGVFNGAKNLKKLLDKKRERARKKKEKAREEGEEVSDDEEEEGK